MTPDERKDYSACLEVARSLPTHLQLSLIGECFDEACDELPHAEKLNLRAEHLAVLSRVVKATVKNARERAKAGPRQD